MRMSSVDYHASRQRYRYRHVDLIPAEEASRCRTQPVTNLSAVPLCNTLTPRAAGMGTRIPHKSPMCMAHKFAEGQMNKFRQAGGTCGAELSNVTWCLLQGPLIAHLRPGCPRPYRGSTLTKTSPCEGAPRRPHSGVRNGPVHRTAVYPVGVRGRGDCLMWLNDESRPEGCDSWGPFSGTRFSHPPSSPQFRTAGTMSRATQDEYDIIVCM